MKASNVLQEKAIDNDHLIEMILSSVGNNVTNYNIMQRYYLDLLEYGKY